MPADPGASAARPVRPPGRSPGEVLGLAGLTLLSGVLFFYRLGDRDLWSSHEGRAAQDAQGMLDRGDWLLPRLFDPKHVDLQKPPGYYWLVAAASRVTGGVEGWSVRLPAAGAGFGLVIGLFLWCRHLGRPLAGFVAATVLATAQHYTWLSRVGRIDIPLAFVVGLSLFGFYRAALGPAGRRPAYGWLVILYAGLATAVLLKGLIGLVLPGLVIGCFLLTETLLRPRGPVFSPLSSRLGLWWGVPLLLLLTLPWFWAADSRTHGAVSKVFFWKHHWDRFFGDDSGLLASKPWWFYAPRLSFDFLPWAPLLPAAVVWFARHGRWRDDPLARFGAVWLAAMVLLLSCAAFKRADYLLPAYPGAALLIGCAAEAIWRRLADRSRQVRIGVGFVSLAFAVLPAGWWVYLDVVLPAEEPAREFRRFAAEIRRLAPAPQPVILFRVEAHALAFHLGEPVDTVMEWENLDTWASRPGCYWVVMAPETAAVWRDHVHAGGLVEVLWNTELAGGRHERPLVLMRTGSQ